jgi:hypothetical protein
MGRGEETSGKRHKKILRANILIRMQHGDGNKRGGGGQKEVVTAAHNACIRELLQEIDVDGKADRHMKLLTLEREISLGSLWDQ